MITFLAGTGPSYRLLKAFRSFVNDRDLGVIVNTGDALWCGGHHLSPQLDATLYLFAGMLNATTWQGIRGDTYTTSRFLQRIGHQELIPTGDKERAICIARGDMLRSGMNLTKVTSNLCEHIGITASLFPMTDAPVQTYIETGDGPIHILEWNRLPYEEKDITGVSIFSEQTPQATEEVLACIQRSDAVIIAPENPFTVIAPILSCKGIKDALNEAFVIIISPLYCSMLDCDRLRTILSAEGIEDSSDKIQNLYQDIADCYVLDIHDPAEGSDAIRLQTRLGSQAQSESLAWDLMAIIRGSKKRG